MQAHATMATHTPNSSPAIVHGAYRGDTFTVTDIHIYTHRTHAAVPCMLMVENNNHVVCTKNTVTSVNTCTRMHTLSCVQTDMRRRTQHTTIHFATKRTTADSRTMNTVTYSPMNHSVCRTHALLHKEKQKVTDTAHMVHALTSPAAERQCMPVESSCCRAHRQI
eukprot:GDKI01000039.1.p1 GENE.GDKI01000039.1~~GDKI01000039.1.p1  ORF type:complete len:165 (+),score=27.10 GDKI01000039.1:101-595(+)